MTSIREKAKAILDAAVPVGRVITSDGPFKADFTKLTMGWTQEKLKSEWAHGKKTTCCMEFVHWYGNQLGATINLGRFDLETALPDQGKEHTWVKSADGAKPQYGDILLHAITHIDVALDITDGKLNRVAAGQGTVGQRDVICRVKGGDKFNWTKLRGWIDIDRFFGPTQPTVSWLLGWWSVWDGNQYYYFFGPNGFVQYTKTRPHSIQSEPHKLLLNQGTYVITAPGILVIDWNPADGGMTRETFINAISGITRMNGTSNRYAPLIATKM